MYMYAVCVAGANWTEMRTNLGSYIVKEKSVGVFFGMQFLCKIKLLLLFCLQMFEQLCNDLADVHPAVLFATFLFGTLGFLYFFWSLTVSMH